MKSEEIEKIVKGIIGDNELSDTILKVVDKIVELPENTETTLAEILGPDNNLDSKQMMVVNKLVHEVCEKLNIDLDSSSHSNQIIGLPFNIPFVKKSK